MSNIDFSGITGPMIQIQALQQKLATMAPGPAHDMIDAQISMLTATAQANAQHMQAQAEASSNLLSALGLVGQLTNTFGTLAPEIINLLK